MNKYLEMFKLYFWSGFNARQRQREKRAIRKDFKGDKELMENGKLDR